MVLFVLALTLPISLRLGEQVSSTAHRVCPQPHWRNSYSPPPGSLERILVPHSSAGSDSPDTDVVILLKALAARQARWNCSTTGLSSLLHCAFLPAGVCGPGPLPLGPLFLQTGRKTYCRAT